jgi:glutamine cyclotransferase
VSARIPRSAISLSTLAIFWIGLHAWHNLSASPCPSPATLHYEVVREIQRSAPGFTEGLIDLNGVLYESVGEYGSSALQKINLKTGQVQKLASLPDSQFGEGLESDDNVLYQLTWKEHRVKRWDLQGKALGDLLYPFEGWGLTRDPNGKWIASDGTEFLRFFDAPPRSGTWNADYSVAVFNGSRAETQLNELEFARGSVFANVYEDTRVVRIDPKSGCVTGEVDFSSLAQKAGIDFGHYPVSVLNGIAYRPDRGTFLITGKNWPMIYEVKLNPAGQN